MILSDLSWSTRSTPGRSDVNLSMIMGAPVTIDVRSDGATLEFNVKGEQQTVKRTIA